MSGAPSTLSETLFTLPPDAQLVQVADLSPRIQAKIGPVDPAQIVVSRPGFRITTRLVTPELSRLMGEFRAPSRLADAVLRFSRAEARNPFSTLEQAFDALAILIDGRVLVPADSPDAKGMPPSLAAGQALAGYEIESLIQALEDSEVYRAVASDETPVAVKIARAGADAPFAHEARVLAHLDGGDSPRLLEAGQADGRAFIAMEWRPGAAVAKVAQQARASDDRPRLKRVVGSVLDAYGRLHAKGVVHGDIHPGNVLVADDGQVTLLDFGRARLDAADGVIDPARAGVPHFYEPEMAAALLAGRTPPATTLRSEQYALAVLAYFLLTGLHPTESVAEHRALLTRIRTRPPLPFAARGVAAWPQAERVLARALAKSPRHRFPDVAAFAAAFRAAAFPPPPRRPPPAARTLLEEALRRALSGEASEEADALSMGWLALRAALIRQDADLLAAADIWACRAESGWEGAALVAEVARARSDARGETQAAAGFIRAADRVEGCEPLLAAARMLDGAGARDVDTGRLAAWSGRRLASMWQDRRADPMLLHAALALRRTGAAASQGDLQRRLDALRPAQGDVWLWSLAHEIYAKPRYAERALGLAEGASPLALLRLYQVTGDPRWLSTAHRRAHAAARRSTTRHPGGLTIALALAELEAPEQSIQPPIRVGA